MIQPGISRRILPVFYVLDTSGSMQGQPIERLNAAMGETTVALQQLAAHNGDAQVRIAVLSFGERFEWMQERGPEDAEDFVWEPLHAYGRTNIGAAIRELNSKLNESAFLRSITGSLTPVIIFMTDGYATDDYVSALNEAMRNPHFREATRVGFAIGKNPDTEMIVRLTGTPEAVIRTDDLQRFADLIRFVSETATSIASVTKGASESNLGAQAVAMGRRMAGLDDETTVVVVPESVQSGAIPIWDMSDPI